jgi:hypothetical protein
MNNFNYETFLDMNLVNVYNSYDDTFDDEFISENKMKYFVYLIVNNNDTYYVGLTNNIKRRTRDHLRTNTNDIKNGSVFIIECLDTEDKMRDMEVIWIAWYKLYSKCVNVRVIDYKLNDGKINTTTIINTNYKSFIDYGIITPLNLLNEPKTYPKPYEKHTEKLHDYKVNNKDI